MEIKHPNGLISWVETFYEMAVNTHHEYEKANSLDSQYEEVTDGQSDLLEDFNNYGRCGIKDTAIEWTNEFEALHYKREWDGEFWDEIDAFIENKLKDEKE